MSISYAFHNNTIAFACDPLKCIKKRCNVKYRFHFAASAAATMYLLSFNYLCKKQKNGKNNI